MNTFYKKIMLVLCLIMYTAGNVVAAETDKLYIADLKLSPGESKTIEVELNNESGIYGLGCDIYLSDGLSFESYYDEDEEDDVYVTFLTTRAPKATGLSLLYNVFDKQHIRIGITSSKGSAGIFRNTEGAIFTIIVKADETANVGQYTLSIKDIEFTIAGADAPYNPADVTSAITLYQNYTVSAQSADEAQGTVTGGGEVESGTPVTLTATAKEGYHFVKWSDDSTEAEYTFTPTGDATLTAEFAPNQYKVTFVADGVTVDEQTLDFGTAITAPATAPEKEGYSFKDWGEVDATVPAKDVTYTAVYTINQYKVTFIADGKTVSEESLDFGAAITAPTAPEKEGHTFKTWGEVAATVPANDVTYIAEYEVNQYKVTFVADGVTVDEKTLDYGAAITAPDAPAKEGYTFKTWGEVAANVPANDVTYTAEYTVNSYKVIYTVDGTEYKSVDVDFGAALTAIDAPEKEGYTFSGWSELPATMPAENVNVTGSFTVNQYTITYYVGNEVWATDTYDFGATVALRTYEPTETRYTFKEWEGETVETMPAHNVELHASIADAIQKLLGEQAKADVYTLSGVKVATQVSADELQSRLGKGIYIINGKKVILK